jgi:NTE family protein
MSDELTQLSAQLRSPVEQTNTEASEKGPEDGIALCLSGDGFRAMLFHVGCLWRLNQTGILPQLNRVSSVSGGSITAGVLGLNWGSLGFDGNGVAQRFEELVVKPVRTLASHTVDVSSILIGLVTGSVADRVADAYRKYLFGHKTLQDLPDKPRFVINSTNLQSKALWRFSKPYMRDYRVGEVKNPMIELAVAVGASSAFPPVLSPVELDLNESDFTQDSGKDLQRPPFTTSVVLTDGGVYDNLGLETAWKRYKTVLISDGGGVYGAEEDPKRDWLNHTKRVMDLLDNQVRALRKRQVVGSLQNGERTGAYWGIWTDIRDYQLPDALDCPKDKTEKLGNTPTRLESMDSDLQERLINWGYAVCDSAIRKRYKTFNPNTPKPVFPYLGGVG